MAHQVDLAWVAPTTGDPVANYVVQRAHVTNGAVGPFAAIASPTETSYIDVNVIAGESYEYEVASQNASGTSSFITSQVVTIPLATPAAPSGLTATAS